MALRSADGAEYLGTVNFHAISEKIAGKIRKIKAADKRAQKTCAILMV
jgi:hypothetical protein